MPLRLPTTTPAPTAPATRSAARFVLGLVAAATLSISLPACSHRPAWAGEGGAPLPPGWSTEPVQRWPGPANTEPLWGVPAFVPPSATHCAGPARLREQPGRVEPQQGLGFLRPAPALADTARRAEVGPGGSTAVGAAAPAAPLSSAKAAAEESRNAAMPAPQAVQRQATMQEIVSAGMVDDNADFGEYQAFRRRSAQLSPRDRDSSERYRVEVRDASGRPAVDAEVALSWPGARGSLRFARTDGAGRVWLMPRLLLAPEVVEPLQAMEVQVRARSGEVVRAPLQRGQKSAVQLQLRQRADAPGRAALDLVFLVDATGSMADEIHKLRDSLRTIANRVGALPSQPDLCFGLVAYRDQGDAFLTRTHDLTNDLGSFQQTLNRLQAGGGGDYPEALNEALDETVHRIGWRGAGTSRLVVLVADAPPHLDRGGPFYDQAAAAALARGIKLHAVGASGLDAQGEVVFRQLAQSTGGRFVFLTYRDARRPDSGPGRDTLHDVHDYSVDTLDELIVRLVRDELATR